MEATKRLIASLSAAAFLSASMPAAAAPPTSSASQEASASDIAMARTLFRQAVRYAQAGQWEQARESYERSLTLRPSSMTRYSLAVAQERTGQWVQALESLRLFLREASTEQEQRYVGPAQQLLASLELRVPRLKLRLASSTPASTQLWLDGQPLSKATLGLDRPLNPGPHQLQAQAPGFEPFHQALRLSEGTRQEVLIRLEPQAKGQTPAATPPPSGPVQQSPGPNTSRTSTAPVLLIATGAGVFVGGLALGLLGYSKAQDSPTRDGSDAEDARRLAHWGDGAMAVGLLTGAVGGYLLYSQGKAKRSAASDTSQLLPLVGPQSGGVQWQGRF